MKYTTQEKLLMAAHHPEIEIEDVKFELCGYTFGDDSPADFVSYIADSAKDDYFSDNYCDGVYVTFRFRDKGAKFEQKYVSFPDFAQIHDPESETDANYICETNPKIVFNEFADDDGRFSVSVPIILRKVTEENENENILETFREHEALFMFGEIVIGNQFVDEHIYSVGGVIPKENEKAEVSKMNIRYELADYDDDDDEEQNKQ